MAEVQGGSRVAYDESGGVWDEVREGWFTFRGEGVKSESELNLWQIADRYGIDRVVTRLELWLYAEAESERDRLRMANRDQAAIIEDYQQSIVEQGAELAQAEASLDHVEEWVQDMVEAYTGRRPGSLAAGLDSLGELLRLGDWLRAEAMWLACKEQASRQAWAEEAMALREKLEILENQVLNRSVALFSGILVGIGGEHDTPPSDEQNWRAVGLIERAIRRKMGPGYVTQAEYRLLCAVEPDEVCACSIDFAALDPGRWSRPQCAVHPTVPDLADDEPPEVWVEAPNSADYTQLVRPAPECSAQNHAHGPHAMPVPDGPPLSCPGQGLLPPPPGAVHPEGGE